MTNHEGPGLFHRLLIALKRLTLGKSTQVYMKQFTGGNEYWERAIAAQTGWPPKEPPQPGPERLRGSGNGVARPGPSVGDTAGCSPGPEYEPVHGWTERQADAYLGRNPSYGLAYEVELRKRFHAAHPRVNPAPAAAP